MRIAYFTLFSILAAAALAAGCASGGGETGAGATTAAASSMPSTPTTTEATTTEPAELPISASERRWLRHLERYAARLKQDFEHAGTVTHESMTREVHLYDECRSKLVRNADPGRFAPAAKPARHACARLTKAARFLRTAISVSDAGGSVLADTPEEATFDRSLNGALEASGNAMYDLDRALDQAHTIEAGLPKS